jgi:hypothetical protein
LPWLERAAFAERLAGIMKTHRFYVAKAASGEGRIARPDRPDAVPIANQMSGPELAKAVRKSLTLKIDLAGVKLRYPLPRLASAILERVDGRSTLEEIHRALKAGDSGLAWNRFKAQFDRTYEVLNGFNLMLVAYPPKGRR